MWSCGVGHGSCSLKQGPAGGRISGSGRMDYVVYPWVCNCQEKVLDRVLAVEYII